MYNGSGWDFYSLAPSAGLCQYRVPIWSSSDSSWRGWVLLSIRTDVMECQILLWDTWGGRFLYGQCKSCLKKHIYLQKNQQVFCYSNNFIIKLLQSTLSGIWYRIRKYVVNIKGDDKNHFICEHGWLSHVTVMALTLWLQIVQGICFVLISLKSF